MRHILSVLLVSLLTLNSAMARGRYLPDSTTRFPSSLRSTISQFGSMVINSSEEARITTAVEGLGIFAFVRVTDDGFDIYDCWEHKDGETRVCSRKLEVTVDEGEDKTEALFSVLNWQRYSMVAVATSDSVTTETIRPHARSVEPYNSDGEGGHRFASQGEFTLIMINLE
jgi:hypothetical protein